MTKTEWLIDMCFVGEVRKIQKHIGVSLLDDRASNIIEHALAISDYVNVSQITNRLSDEYFEKYFKPKNIHNPIILNHLIEKLSDFENWTTDYRKTSSLYTEMCLKYKGEWCGIFDFKKITGHDNPFNFVYQYSNTIAYYYGYEKGRDKLKKYGIGSFGGGSAADYIRGGIIALKPHILEVVSELKLLTH